jgi:hypothetical protein
MGEFMENEASNRPKANRPEAASSKGSVVLGDRNPIYERILNSKRFLKTEDAKLYEQDLQALVDDIKPQSFLDWKNVEDYADKLQDERRYKNAIPRLIDGKTESRKGLFIAEKGKQEAFLIEGYLPSLIKLTRLADNSFDLRKRIEKDFRRMARARPTSAAPSIVPEDENNG